MAVWKEFSWYVIFNGPAIAQCFSYWVQELLHSLLSSWNYRCASLLLALEGILRPHPDLAWKVLSSANGTKQGCMKVCTHLLSMACASVMGNLVNLECIFWYLTVYH